MYFIKLFSFNTYFYVYLRWFIFFSYFLLFVLVFFFCEKNLVIFYFFFNFFIYYSCVGLLWHCRTGVLQLVYDYCNESYRNFLWAMLLCIEVHGVFYVNMCCFL